MFSKSEYREKAEIILGNNTKTQKDFNKLIWPTETKRKNLTVYKCQFPHSSSNNQLHK